MLGELTLVAYDGEPYRNIAMPRIPRTTTVEDVAKSRRDQDYVNRAADAGEIVQTDPYRIRALALGNDMTFPFERANWKATRFSDGTRFGVWYGSEEIETTVRETVAHWVQFLQDTPPQPEEIRTDRQVFQVRVRDLLVDLRPKVEHHPRLLDRGDYGLSQQVGHYLHAAGQHGILIPSARGPGTNIDIFHPDSLGESRLRGYLTYRYRHDNPEVLIERDPGQTWMRVRIADVL